MQSIPFRFKLSKRSLMPLLLALGLSACDYQYDDILKQVEKKKPAGAASKPFDLSLSNVGNFVGEDIKGLADEISYINPQSMPINLDDETESEEAVVQDEPENALNVMFGNIPQEQYFIAFTAPGGYQLSVLKGQGLRVAFKPGILSYLGQATEQNVVEHLTNNIFFHEYQVRESDIIKYEVASVTDDVENTFPRIAHMSDAEATKLKESAYIILVCNLKAPWLQSLLSKEVSSVKHPVAGNRLDLLLYMDLVHVWLVDRASGRVVQKWS